MTRQDVLALAERLVRPAFEEREIEGIDVREEEDWSGTPSLYIDAFLTPGSRRLDAKSWSSLKLLLSEELLAKGEQRFAYIRLRDRAAEGEPIPDEAA